MADYSFTIERIIISRVATIEDSYVEVTVKTKDKNVLDYFDKAIPKLCEEARKDLSYKS